MAKEVKEKAALRRARPDGERAPVKAKDVGIGEEVFFILILGTKILLDQELFTWLVALVLSLQLYL